MNKKRILFLAFIANLLLTSPTIATETQFQFEGRWCGKWDNIYQTCFTIERTKEGYKTLYQWEEHLAGGFQEKTIVGKQLNANTLDFKGKIIIFDLKNHQRATAVGIFQHHSRTAELTLVN
jgi:hypothetical protein